MENIYLYFRTFLTGRWLSELEHLDMGSYNTVVIFHSTSHQQDQILATPKMTSARRRDGETSALSLSHTETRGRIRCPVLPSSSFFPLRQSLSHKIEIGCLVSTHKSSEVAGVCTTMPSCVCGVGAD